MVVYSSMKFTLADVQTLTGLSPFLYPQGISYFQAKDNHGVLVLPAKVYLVTS